MQKTFWLVVAGLLVEKRLEANTGSLNGLSVAGRDELPTNDEV